jgi:hypothetical protein
MKDKDFAELKGSLTEALAHARGKVTLRTRDIPLPAPAQCGLEVLGDFFGNHVRGGEIGAVFEAFVLQPALGPKYREPRACLCGSSYFCVIFALSRLQRSF